MPETPAAEPESKLKRLPVLVDATGLAIVKRAISLKLATLASTEEETAELHGCALVAIVAAWMQAEAERIRSARP